MAEAATLSPDAQAADLLARHDGILRIGERYMGEYSDFTADLIEQLPKEEPEVAASLVTAFLARADSGDRLVDARCVAIPLTLALLEVYQERGESLLSQLLSDSNPSIRLKTIEAVEQRLEAERAEITRKIGFTGMLSAHVIAVAKDGVNKDA